MQACLGLEPLPGEAKVEAGCAGDRVRAAERLPHRVPHRCFRRARHFYRPMEVIDVNIIHDWRRRVHSFDNG
jgi:hypothetical protein